VLRKKGRTILLPYILWNVLAIIFFYAAQSFSFTRPYFATIIIQNLSVLDWIGAFTGKSGLFADAGIVYFKFIIHLN
jgi:hypothetical protein